MGKFSKKYYYNSWRVALYSEYTLCDFITDNDLEEDKIISVIKEEKNNDGNFVYLIIFKHKIR